MQFARTPDGGIVATATGTEWDYERDDYVEEIIFTLSQAEADALVVAHLRGPMGPPGPTGPMGVRGPRADEGRP